ncbi:MAG: T9SS type A sorting domain-containing protein [Gemmatimonadaceae bacterium]|nr:T9SS type A sorting domain-containing protein [Gemmatimonadaceae bacterium]
MEKARWFHHPALWICLLSAQTGVAHDHFRWGLPEGAVARFGKGSLLYPTFPSGGILHPGAGTVVYSSDGTRLAVTGGFGVWIHDAVTGVETAVLTGQEEATSVAFSPDGGTLAIGNLDGTIQLWDPATGQVKATLASKPRVLTVTYLSDSTLASGSSDGVIRLWDPVTGRLDTTLSGHQGPVLTMSSSQDGRTLASGGADASVRLWDVVSGRLKATLEGHGNAVNSVSISPDGRTLASGSDDRTVRLWDAGIGEHLATFDEHERWVTSVTFSPDGGTLASCSQSGIRLWDTDSSRYLARPMDGGFGCRTVVFSPDGSVLASGVDRSGDFRVWLWELATRRVRVTIEGYPYWQPAVVFSPDGTTLAQGIGGRVQLRDAATGQVKATLERSTGFVLGLAFSPDGTLLASSGSDLRMEVWDVATGELRVRVGDVLGFVGFSFSPDGSILASGNIGGEVRLWEGTSGKLKATLQGHTGTVISVVYSPDGRTLVSGSTDGLRLWDTTTLQQKAILEEWGEVSSLAQSPNGAILATGNRDGRIGLWDAATLQDKGTLQRDWARVSSLAFSSDGSALAIGSEDGSVRLWDPVTGRLEGIGDHLGAVMSVTFSPDGSILASSSRDGTALLWDSSSWDAPNLSFTVVEATIPNAARSMALEFSRSVSGRPADYAWGAVADSAGHLELTISSTQRSGVSGLYQARAVSPDGRVLGEWPSIPLNADRRQVLELPLRGPVRLMSSEPLAAAREVALDEEVHGGLLPNAPNPFNAGTQISYRLVSPGPVRLVIYNALGQAMRRLVDRHQTAGYYQVHWDGRDQRGDPVGSGIYFSRLQAGPVVHAGKMVVVR